MLEVAHLADGGITILENQPNFTRGKLDMGIFTFLGDQLSIGARSTGKLATLAQFQFDIMNQRARRDITKGKGVAGFDVSCWTGDQPVPDL